MHRQVQLPCQHRQRVVTDAGHDGAAEVRRAGQAFPLPSGEVGQWDMKLRIMSTKLYCMQCPVLTSSLAVYTRPPGRFLPSSTMTL